MRHRIFCKKFIIAFLSLAFIFSLIPISALAASYRQGNSAVDKLVASAINKCYGRLNKASYSLSNYTISGNGNANTEPPFYVQFDDDSEDILFPNTFIERDDGKATVLSCTSLFWGSARNPEWSGIVPSADATSVSALMNRLKFKKTNNQDSETAQLTFSVTVPVRNGLEVKYVTYTKSSKEFKIDADGSILNTDLASALDNAETKQTDNDALQLRDNGNDTGWMLYMSKDYFDEETVEPADGESISIMFDLGWFNCGSGEQTCKLEDAVDAFNKMVDNQCPDGDCDLKPTLSHTISSLQTDSKTDTYEKQSNSASEFAKEITGHGISETLTDREQFDIYVSYLKRKNFVTLSCFKEDQGDTSSVGTKVNNLKSGESEYCYAQEAKSIDKSYVNVTPGDSETYLTLAGVINKINSLTGITEPVDVSTIANPGDSVNPGGGPEQPQTEATCHSEGNALGWILCPVLELSASATKWAYESAIEPALHTRTELFKTDGDRTGAYQAWKIFRDFANIIFIIFLFIIIISQLTGVGIDNYGIKKALPKLVVSAILINISFFICQTAIDLSNIAGNGIYSLFSGIANSITVPENNVFGIAYDISIVFMIVAVLSGFITIAVAQGSFWQTVGPALLAFVPVVLSAVVAILFLFFMLSLRQALTVLLVAISPLAFACYFLPNTKNLFDRWTQLLRGMLLLYPICAAMIAGGRLASKIILASANGSDIFIIITAMVAEAGPLFLIPGITRAAYRATGQLGAALGRFGGRITGGTRNAIRNNGAYKRAGERVQRDRANNPNSLAQRRVRNYNRAVRNRGTANARPLDWWRLRRGNQERVAQINEGVLKADAENMKITNMSNQTIVTGMQRGARLGNDALVGRAEYHGSMSDLAYGNARQAARGQGATSAEQQIVNSANYRDANFQRAVIQQAETQSEATRQNTMHYNDPTYRAAAAAALERKELQENIKSRESLLVSGEFESNGHRVNGFNTDEVRNALIHALGSGYTGTDRRADIHALVNTLAAQGDAGRSAVFQALQTAETSGGIDNDARRALARNIMENHAADFKNNQRSVFDYARANTGDTVGQVTLGDGGTRNARFADFNAKATANLNQEQLVNMDESELERYLNALRGYDRDGHVVTNRLNRRDSFASDAAGQARYIAAERASQRQLHALAVQALGNEQVAKNLKGRQRELLVAIQALENDSDRANP